MKRAIIVHGFKGKPDTNWKPWLKAELEANGFIVDVPGMPNTDAPQLEEWVATLRQIIGEFTSDDIYLIGHSLGCITILIHKAF
jgi:predicted alpha/beta hydrolase family esterase